MLLVKSQEISHSALKQSSWLLLAQLLYLVWTLDPYLPPFNDGEDQAGSLAALKMLSKWPVTQLQHNGFWINVGPRFSLCDGMENTWHGLGCCSAVLWLHHDIAECPCLLK